MKRRWIRTDLIGIGTLLTRCLDALKTHRRDQFIGTLLLAFPSHLFVTFLSRSSCIFALCGWGAGYVFLADGRWDGRCLHSSNMGP